MCELLGVSAAMAVRLDRYYDEFRSHAAANPDGWGIAWWDGDEPTVVKEGRAAHESDLAERVGVDHPPSRTFVVHVRAASVGALTVDNAHPFVGPVGERTWVFAHNGTVEDLAALDPGRFTPTGETDSERAFHHLLTRLERRPAETDAELAEEVLATARELSEGENRVNFLLSDGRDLFAWYDGHKTLHLLEQDTEAGPMVVLASLPVSDEAGWEALAPGTFVAARDGRVVRRVDPGPAFGHDAWSTNATRSPGGNP